MAAVFFGSRLKHFVRGIGWIDPSRTRIYISRLPTFCYQSSSTKAQEDEDNKPLKFTSSQASSWKAKHSRGAMDDDDKPWYQGLVVSLSTGVFLLYFCVLREENDVDEELGKSLYGRIEGLEENQLKLSLKYNEEHGLDTSAIKQRLREIQEERM
ncbi:ubiquinol-cytochrome c reductase complex assembly factor 4 [Anabrus simplex]|uniref:ubiquinol-cytochrome c reductase complex assembly factor 4 n=1 Tax=Anabrus simplex TaxID=316456 RepID=UPI0035A3C688